MTRSKEFRRINEAIQHRNEPELRWALGFLKLRKGAVLKLNGAKWSGKMYELEMTVSRALADIEKNDPNR